VLDQATKYWAEEDLQARPGKVIRVIDGFFDLRYARNPGAAFSLFSKMGPTTRGVFFIAVSVLAVALMLYLYRRMEERRPLYEWALGLLIGGALGNLVDRLRFNQVIDFLDFDLQFMRWPTFNVADSAIVIGIGLVLLDAFRSRRKPAPKRRA
jgi:signal peptidase II